MSSNNVPNTYPEAHFFREIGGSEKLSETKSSLLA
jgi:hypothetical protein